MKALIFALAAVAFIAAPAPSLAQEKKEGLFKKGASADQKKAAASKDGKKKPFGKLKEQAEKGKK